MKYYHPAATGDYLYVCDYCEIDDGRPVSVWHSLPKKRGHFALCTECVKKLYFMITGEPETTVVRAIVPESLLNKVLERDHHQCVKCGSTSDLHLDHIIPFSKGGKTEEGNLQTLCKKCNFKKGNKT